jgi:hypothetical protein
MSDPSSRRVCPPTHIQMEVQQVRKTIRYVRFGMRPSLQMPSKGAKIATLRSVNVSRAETRRASQALSSSNKSVPLGPSLTVGLLREGPNVRMLTFSRDNERKPTGALGAENATPMSTVPVRRSGALLLKGIFCNKEAGDMLKEHVHDRCCERTEVSDPHPSIARDVPLFTSLGRDDEIRILRHRESKARVDRPAGQAGRSSA